MAAAPVVMLLALDRYDEALACLEAVEGLY